VRGETESSSAISSAVSPPKTRNATTGAALVLEEVAGPSPKLGIDELP
jgi:hypothetical protein